MSRGNRALLAGMVGFAAGTVAAGGTYLIRRRLSGRLPDRAQERLEIDVVDALCTDEVAGRCAIDVAALGPGLIELSGGVPDQAASGRAAEVAQRVPGVHTVINRLAVEVVEQQLDATRRRYGEGDPELRAGGWEGMRSGMGSRRPGPAIDAEAADESVPVLEDSAGLDDSMR